MTDADADADDENNKEDVKISSDGEITGEEEAPKIGPFHFFWKKDPTATNKGSEEEAASDSSNLDDTSSRQDDSENSGDMFEKPDTPVMADKNGSFFGKLLGAKRTSLPKEDVSLIAESKARATDTSIDDAVTSGKAEASKSNDSVDDETSGSNNASGSWGFFSKLRGVKQEPQLDTKKNNTATENQETPTIGEVESPGENSNDETATDEIVTDGIPEKVDNKVWPISKLFGGRSGQNVLDVDPSAGDKEDENLKKDDLTNTSEEKLDTTIAETDEKESLSIVSAENPNRDSTESRKRASFISMFLDPSASANQASDETKKHDEGEDLVLEEGIRGDQEEEGEELVLEEAIEGDQEEKSVEKSFTTASTQKQEEPFHNAVEFVHDTELELEMELSEGGNLTPSSLLTDGPYWDDNEKPKKEEMCCSLFCRH